MKQVVCCHFPNPSYKVRMCCLKEWNERKAERFDKLATSYFSIPIVPCGSVQEK